MYRLQRYLFIQLGQSIALVLLALTGLFAFFDVIGELDELGKHSYALRHLVLWVGLSIPAHLVELLPIATLIGAIFAVAQLADQSEFTMMRMAGLFGARLLLALLPLAFILITCAVALSEWVQPMTDQRAKVIQQIVRGQLPTAIDESGQVQQFKSGYWLKDIAGQSIRFVNVQQLQTQPFQLQRVTLYHVNTQFQLVEIIFAESMQPSQNREKFETDTNQTTWQLMGVTRQLVRGATASTEPLSLQAAQAMRWTVEQLPQMSLSLGFDAPLFNTIRTQPMQSNLWQLHQLIQYLQQVGQDASIAQLTWWQKFYAPLSCGFFLLLALPFASLNHRAGGVASKVFIGVLIGVALYFVQKLIAHLTLLHHLPAGWVLSAFWLSVLSVNYAILWFLQQR
jgi:lipopolysaccharide export system permease protein